MATNSPNYDALLDQIQALSELQSNGGAQCTDPVKQAAYVKKLQQQADSIKKLLKLLNTSKASTAAAAAAESLNVNEYLRCVVGGRDKRFGDGDKCDISDLNGGCEAKILSELNGGKRDSAEFGDLNGGKRDSRELTGYEQLWELSTTVCEDEVPEVGENEDVLEDVHRFNQHYSHGKEQKSFLHDQTDLYENTAVSLSNVTLSVEVPPPLPPRLPNRSINLCDRTSQSEISLRSGSDRVTSSSARSQPLSRSEDAAAVKYPPSVGEINFEKFSVGGPNCSTPHPPQPAQQTRSCITSTPKETNVTDRQDRIQALKKQREELISSLQTDEQERQWYYTQLQLIAQKIRSIPLTSSQSYSLENEAARQALEERAARVQSNMQRELGDPERGIRLRRQRVEQVQEIDKQLAEMERLEQHNNDDFHRRGGTLPEAARRGLEDGYEATGRRTGEANRRGGGRGGDEPNRRNGRGGEESGRRAGHPQSCNLEQLYHESLPMDRALSHSGPPAFGGLGEDSTSVMSFTSSVHSVGPGVERAGDHPDSNSLMSLLGCTDVDKMSRTLLAMSSSPANCDMMRGSRCIPLLVQLLHMDAVNPNLPRPARPVRARAARCLHNIVHAHPTDKHCKREAKVLKLLEVLRQYCDLLRDILANGDGRAGGNSRAEAQAAGCRRVTIKVVEGGEKYQEQDLMVADFGNIGDQHPSPCKQVYACQHFLDFSGEARQNGQVINIEESMAVLTRCSFDESHRQPIFLLGGIPALAELIQVEHGLHLPTQGVCREVRRYAVVALTNLTFGNTGIKSYLCQFPGLVDILVGQLESQWENLRKATAHLFRNLAWKADKSSKSVLAESRVVTVLMACAVSVSDRCKMETSTGTAIEPGRDEPTLKVILSALWNLSAHCRKNKSEVCSYPGALRLLVQFLRSRSTAVVENGGGILRNISSYIATCQQGEEYRKVLREEECLSLLLSQLGSPSLTIVSNSCGTLWNFSARNQEDQEKLWELGAVPMLQSLTNSKHKTISTCSLAALKNLYTARPAGLFMMVSGVGTGQLTARKVKNLVADLDEKLSDCGGKDVEDGKDSPGNTDDSCSEGEEVVGGASTTAGSGVATTGGGIAYQRSESRNSMSSVPSVTSHYSEGGGRGDRSSISPDISQKSNIVAAGASDFAPISYQNGPRNTRDNSRENDKPALPKRGGEGSGPGFSGLTAEGRFDSHYKSYMKQQSTYSDPKSAGNRHGSPLRDNYVENESERVMSPSKLSQAAMSSPASVPLDLSKKKKAEPVYSDEVELCEEKPTDYSLRYQECEEPELLNNKSGDKSNQLFDDSVKTYYTEGTPLDTPYAFSTATSLSDLREPAIQEEEDEEAAEEDKQQGDTTTAYAVEGTPVTFSRAESLSSLESGEVDGPGEGTKLSAIPETGEEKGMQETEGSDATKEDGGDGKTPPPPHHQHHHSAAAGKDHKTVTFRGGVGAAHDTPLMFSRASSIASLDSFDQQSIPDGYSSCDFSRATSGRVSPSDLPDSPSQTMPGSPRRSHQPLPRPNRNVKPPLAPEAKKPMFEDGVKTYEEEGTPAVFSTRTSLSGLTFDDDPPTGGQPPPPKSPAVKEAWPEKVETKKDEEGSNQQQQLSDDEDIYADSESLLNQIISSGMPEGKSAAGKQSKIPQPKGWTKGLSPSPRLNESATGGSDDSVCSAESTDILEACIASAMPSKNSSKSPLSRLVESSGASKHDLGPRQAGEGAPATEGIQRSRKQIQPPKKFNRIAGGGVDRRAPVQPPIDRRGQDRRGAPPPPERRGSHLSHPCVAAAAACTADLDEESRNELQTKDKIRNPNMEQLRGYSRVEDQLRNYRVDAAAEDHIRSYGVEDTPINFSAATSLSDLTVDDHLTSGRMSVDSHDGLLEHRRQRRAPATRSRLASGSETGPAHGMETPYGRETPRRYATEDTPAVFSRNDSLSSLEYDDRDFNVHKDGAASRVGVSTQATSSSSQSFQSHLPRPLTVGRSASSGSSTGAPEKRKSDTAENTNKSFNSSLSSLSMESLNHTNADEEDLLKDCISSAMPKSKSEHADLAGKMKKTRKSPKRDKSKSVERERKRSSSKSPRNSRIIPGVVIPELKLKPRTPPKSRPQSSEIDAAFVPLIEDSVVEEDRPATVLRKSSVEILGNEDEPDVFHQLPIQEQLASKSQPSSQEQLPSQPFLSSQEQLSSNPQQHQKEDVQHHHQGEQHPAASKEEEKSDIEKNIAEMTLTLTQSRISDLEGLSSSSRTSDLDGMMGSVIQREAGVVAASFVLSQDLSLTGSQYSEVGEGLSMVQPPSIMMESLPSLSQPASLPTVNRRPSDVRLECRHTVSGKVGSQVPLAVRRALGSSNNIGSMSQEDLSSLSSCHSNLDNIRPPTIMDDIDMENSMLSVASISSEIAGSGGALVGSRGSDDTSAMSLNSEAILEIVRPAGAAVEAFSKNRSLSSSQERNQSTSGGDDNCPTVSLKYSQTSISCGLESIEPPTSMEDATTLVNSNTLVPTQEKVAATYVVGGDEAGDTIADITDVFDEESLVEPTLTAGGSDAVDGDVPDLPRDSRHTTPAQSGGESSVENTPLPVRRISPRQRRQMEPDRYLTYTKNKENNSSPRDESTDTTSGYKSQESWVIPVAGGREARSSSRQQRLVNEDRFRTRTISREDLGGSSAPGSPANSSPAHCKPSPAHSSASHSTSSPAHNSASPAHTTASPKTLKQRRAEESERFKTQTIHPADLSLQPEDFNSLQTGGDIPLSPQEVAILETEARLVVETITERKAEVRSRSTSVDIFERERSRSASVEILKDHEMLSIDADVGSIASRENLLDIREGPEGDGDDREAFTAAARPRIVKPWESRVAAEEVTSKGIRGRRRVLYSPPMKRATVPPAVPPKPSASTAAKSRTNSSPVTSPKLVRGTRAMALRQAQNQAKKDSNQKTSPKTSPRSLNSSGSPRSLSSGGSPTSRTRLSGRTSRTQSPISSAEKPAMVRQGTFTKDDAAAASVAASPKSSASKTSGIPRQSAAAGRQASSSSLRSVSATNRTPPKVPPKPNMFRRDTVQPSPLPKPLVATTKTQQLREKSLTRGGLRSSNSSTSSVASRASTTSRTSIRTSSSSHSLRNACEGVPKRTPSSSEIERRRSNLSRPMSPVGRKPSTNGTSRPLSPPDHRAVSPSTTITAGRPFKSPEPVKLPKKDVTSKIASLWKKVEESKKQKKDTAKDKRVWISKGKVQQPEETTTPAPGRLIRSGTYEKLTEPTQEVSSRQSEVPPAVTKPRSRSRLSIKLSKFGLKKKGTTSMEDQMNGNTPVSPEDELGNSLTSPSDLASPTTTTDGQSVVISPEPQPFHNASESSESMSTGPDHPADVGRSAAAMMMNRSPASAIVPPFTYMPNGQAVVDQLKNAQLKRNSSYVSSMGRKQEVESSSDENMAVKGSYSNTSSSVVTLV